MITINVDERYLEILQPIVNAEYIVQQALEKYAIDLISSKISLLAHKKRTYEEQFEETFETFSDKVATDITFLEQLEQQYPKWESDFLEWEFCVKGIQDWKQKLEHILTIKFLKTTLTS